MDVPSGSTSGPAEGPTDGPADAPADGLVGLYLMGLRGSGKTSLGEELALQLGFRHVDLDESIATREGRPVQEVLQDLGEEGFRSIEHRQLKFELGGLLRGGRVLSLGGGSIENAEIRKILKMLRNEKHWVGVWIECEPRELERRIGMSGGTGTRPRLLGRGLQEEMRILLTRRSRYFKELSDHRFANPGGRIEQRARELLSILGQAPQS